MHSYIPTLSFQKSEYSLLEALQYDDLFKVKMYYLLSVLFSNVAHSHKNVEDSLLGVNQIFQGLTHKK